MNTQHWQLRKVGKSFQKILAFSLITISVFSSLTSFAYAQEISASPEPSSSASPSPAISSSPTPAASPVLTPLPGDTTPVSSPVSAPVSPSPSNSDQVSNSPAPQSPAPETTPSPTTSPSPSPQPTASPSPSPTPDAKKKTTTKTAALAATVSPTMSGTVKDVLNPNYQLTPDQTNGSFNYEYPIKVPPGRNAMAPDIRLEYNNQVGEDISPYGFGWTDNIPYIRRINRLGVNNLYTLATSTTASTTFFYSSLSGELATTSTATSYISKVDNGDYLKYSFVNNAWTVTDKNGTQYVFGSSTSAQIASSTDSTRTYQWNLEKVQDTNGNYISYSYYKDAGQIYPSRVTYTNYGGATGIYEIDFQRQARTDIATSSKASFDIVDNYLISEIDVKTNGTTYHKYVLNYTKGNNGRRSLLNSVTETGYDESLNATTLPATTFSYSTTTPGWTENSNWHLPVPLSEPNFGFIDDHGVRLVDINGDGLTDIVQYWNDAHTSTSGQHTFINTGNGFVDNPIWYVPTPITFETGSLDTIDGSVVFADLNGDGLQDVIYSWDSRDFGAIRHVYINNGHGFTEDNSWNFPIALVRQDSGGNLYDNAVRFADINGDGLVDVIQSYNQQDGTLVRNTYINNGHGFTLDHNWDLPVGFYMFDDGNNYVPIGTVLLDLNADGLPDIIQAVENKYGTLYYDAYVNNGHGFTRDDAWNSPILFDNLDNFPGDLGSRIMDVNSDGLPDIVRAYSDAYGPDGYQTYINTGHGFSIDQSRWHLPVTFIKINTGDSDLGTQAAEINGDGVDDEVRAFQDDIESITDFRSYTNNTSKPDILTGVALSKGGTISVGYQATPMYTAVGTTTPLNSNLPLVLQTVKTITNNDAEGNVGTTTYSYSGGVYYFNNPYDRKFGGFQTVTATDPAGNVTKSYFHTGTGTDATHGEYQDNEYKIGKPYRIEKYDANGSLFEKTINKWDSYARQANADFVMLDQTVDETYDGTANHKDKAESYSYDNSTGNITQKTEWGQVTGADDGTFTDTGTDKFTTNISYASSGGSNVIGLPSDETKLDQSSVTVAETRHYYDNLSLGSVGAGNETKTEKLKSGSTYINTQKTYDSYGNVTQEKDPLGNATNYTYTSATYNLYPATSTNALSQATGYIYNFSLGKVKQSNDPNGLISQVIYDGFGRKEQEKEPDLTTPTTLDTKSVYSYNDSGIPTSVHETDYMTPSLAVDTYNYYDGFARLIQSKKTTNTAGSYITKDQVYDTRGLLSKETLPYFSSSSSNTSPTATSSLYINYSYDALQRLGTTTNAVGTTTNVYNNWKLTITDPRGKTKDLYSDAYNNPIQVDEHNSGNTYSTYYTYNGLNDLTKITDALGNIRNFTYDNLGRRTKAEDLHASADTTFGSTTFAYDNASNLTQQLDAKNQTVNYTYDALNRPLTEDYTGLAGTEVKYGYDSCTLGIGKLCSATTTDATSTYTYNSLGSVASEKKDIGAKSFTTSYTYDQLGNVNIITYPDNSRVEYNYSTGGLPASVYQAESAHLFHILVSSITYSPLNQITKLNYVSNEMVQTNTYDQNHMYRLTNMVTTSTTTTPHIQDLSFTYDQDGNITQTTDNSNTDSKKTITYTYDDLNRLTQASSTGAVAGGNYLQTYSYDALGNFSNKSDVGNYTYAGNTGSSYADPDAATTIGSTNYSYDNNGNLTSTSAGLTNTWNYRNQLTQSVLGSANVTYGYDYNGDRVKYANASSTTYYANKYYNIGTTTASTEKHIFLNGQVIGLITNTGSNAGTLPITVDNLGSTNVVQNTQGAVQELVDYYPYGSLRLDEKFGTPLPEQRKFTGKEYDLDTGLTYFGARYQNPSIGRFVSEDPVFLEIGSLDSKKQNTFLSDPQQLNSYSYARNNPLRIIDPTGKFNVSTGQVEKGDTLSAIVSQINSNFGTNYTVSGLAASNNIGNPNLIYAGSYINFSRAVSNTSYNFVPVFNVNPGFGKESGAGNNSFSTPGVTGFVGGMSNEYQSIDPNILNPQGFTREDLLNQTDDPDLISIISKLFQFKDALPGGTAGAVRYTNLTGELVGNSDHIQAASDRARWIEKYLSDPEVSESDAEIGQALLNDLNDALDSLGETLGGVAGEL